MDNITWSPNFSVGNTLLDNQHKKIIEIINQILTESEIKGGAGTVFELVDSLAQYASEHFSTEEALLAECGYLELEEHRAEHNEYRNNTTKFFIGAVDEDGTISNEILQFVVDWWFNHILRSDMAYKPFLSKHDSI